MSKTENTRPWWVQMYDESEPGEVYHWCTRNQRGRHRLKRRHKGIFHVTLRDEYGQLYSATHRSSRGSWAKFLEEESAKAGLPLEIERGSAWRKSGEPAHLECSYLPHHPPRTRLEARQRLCHYGTDHPGGKRYLGGNLRYERKLRRRRLRQRERAQLWLAKYRGYDADFDVLPIREDGHTLLFDLS